MWESEENIDGVNITMDHNLHSEHKTKMSPRTVARLTELATLSRAWDRSPVSLSFVLRSEQSMVVMIPHRATQVVLRRFLELSR